MCIQFKGSLGVNLTVINCQGFVWIVRWDSRLGEQKAIATTLSIFLEIFAIKVRWIWKRK